LELSLLYHDDSDALYETTNGVSGLLASSNHLALRHPVRARSIGNLCMAKRSLEKRLRALETITKQQSKRLNNLVESVNNLSESVDNLSYSVDNVAGLDERLDRLSGVAIPDVVRSVATDVLQFALEYQRQPQPALTTSSFKDELQRDGALADALKAFADLYNEQAALPATAVTLAEILDRTIDDYNCEAAHYTDEASLYKDVIKAQQLLSDHPYLIADLRDQHYILSHYDLLREVFGFSDSTASKAQSKNLSNRRAMRGGS
jgi:uncharacterized coiled-coil protein SlyX